MKGGGQRQGRVRNQHGAPCRPSPGERGGGGTTPQTCHVGGPRLRRVEGEPGVSTLNASSARQPPAGASHWLDSADSRRIRGGARSPWLARCRVG